MTDNAQIAIRSTNEIECAQLKPFSICCIVDFLKTKWRKILEFMIYKFWNLRIIYDKW